MKKRFFSMILALAMVLCLIPGMSLTASAKEAVPYVYYTVDDDGTLTRREGICEEYEIVQKKTFELEDGKWYVVKDAVQTTIEVKGEANLILCDGATLSTNERIEIGRYSTLNIYAQAAGTGAIVADNEGHKYAPIGGFMYTAAGTINIHGGNITATSGSSAAAIGGGEYGAGGIVTIYDGMVTAVGGTNSAGIGGGAESTGGQLTIYGGTVIASGYVGVGAGEGGNDHGTLTLGDGVTFGARNDASNITVTGNKGNASDAFGKNYFVSQYAPPVPYVYYTMDNGTAVCGNCTEYETVTGETTAFGSDRWYVVSENVTVNSRITVSGTANLILCDGAKLTASNGIAVTKENTLNIYAQNAGTGALIATTDRDGGAAIGGDTSDGGSINIHGGSITATGNDQSAGIGGGNHGDGGTITINGGEVNATGGYLTSAIGGGNGGTVSINSGKVTAIGNDNGGYALGGLDGSITINGGTVTAIGSARWIISFFDEPRCQLMLGEGVIFGAGDDADSITVWSGKDT